jgi:hypothetical protein
MATEETPSPSNRWPTASLSAYVTYVLKYARTLRRRCWSISTSYRLFKNMCLIRP